MNTYSKLANGDWGIRTEAAHRPGDTVSVSLRSGRSKIVTLGAFLYEIGEHRVYAVAAAAPRQEVAVGDLAGIVAMFDRARQHLKFPKIAFDGFRVSVAGDRARVPGSLTITASEKSFDGRRAWFGRVLRNGTYQPSQDAPAHVADRLREFAADPAGTAAAYGRLNGSCCFCQKALRDERSTAVGYGPDCANNYGLPWGERRTGFFADAA